MHFLHVVGARPNFMKVAPVYRAIASHGASQTLLHTGQHYDAQMSDVFFRQLEIPEPDVNLNVGSGTHAQQTAQIMRAFEPVVLERKPDVVLVYGDVNSTVAAALVCAKLNIRVAHVEAGLRSFDRTMPEEINRLVTDQLADLLFTPSPDGDENLLHEGVAREKIHFVGNVMIDTLARLLPSARALVPQLRQRLPVDCSFILVTLHRPSNVDDEASLREIVSALNLLSRDVQILFPVHPRTRKLLDQINFKPSERFRWIEPLGYLEFLALQSCATAVITDSGGIQEETTFLQTPCITVRENTERPVTVSQGTNVLVGHDLALLQAKALEAIAGKWKNGRVPDKWDGNAAERIAAILTNIPRG
jgi:UDP-N-acetylglucosamine 2-epimerase (non-hydrolysing)